MRGVTLWMLMITAVIDGAVSNTDKIEVLINEYKNCAKDDLAMRMDNMTIEMDPDIEDLYLYGTLNLTVPFEDEMKIKLVISKCLNSEEASCTKYMAPEMVGICQHLPEENKPWTEFVQHLVGFVPKCPIAPGEYKIDRAPLRADVLEKMKLATGHWRLLSTVELNGKELMCVTTSAELKKVRRKRKDH